MEIRKKWSIFSEENVKSVPSVYGVYELADSKKSIIYIGQGKLQERLMDHLNNIKKAKYFRFEQIRSKEKAEQREKALLREYRENHGHLPNYNERMG